MSHLLGLQLSNRARRRNLAHHGDLRSIHGFRRQDGHHVEACTVSSARENTNNNVQSDDQHAPLRCGNAIFPRADGRTIGHSQPEDADRAAFRDPDRG